MPRWAMVAVGLVAVAVVGAAALISGWRPFSVDVSTDNVSAPASSLCCASDFARQVLSFFKQHRAGLAVLGQEAAAYEFRA